MPFVTKLRLQSGDVNALDRVVTDIKETAERKGAELKGPHPKPPDHYRVPQHKRVDGGDTFAPWDYTVYTRTIEIVGHDEFARDVTERSYPDSVYVSAEIEQLRQAGNN
ncbi:uS10/mL48 family ribosomal protein [Salinibaculum rarum]|uniref:uS10/mL48 family ribosomal protein n=1 Tax=Salinibaculum rarum TaxID=3058903 RepID=UPI00265EB255|nr:uS10/mL48 family ribosomal protein [Salinibaculum sp. KK48]